MEYGLALDELSGMKTSGKRKAQGESGVKQCSGTLHHHRRDSLMVTGGSCDRERVPAEGGRAAAAQVLRWKYNCACPRRVRQGGIIAAATVLK